MKVYKSGSPTRAKQHEDIFDWTNGEIEEDALAQAKELAKMPFIHHHVALMADAHLGYGMPIGGVAAFDGVVSPYCVGNDIGCGMLFMRTSIPIDKLMPKRKELRHSIERVIPKGEGNAHKEPQPWDGFTKYRATTLTRDNLPLWITDKNWVWVQQSLGSLGGGNHFIEIQLDEDGYICVMIHCGSRNLGALICKAYHDKAFALNRRWYSYLEDDKLAYMPVDNEFGHKYLVDMNFALDFAKENRLRIWQRIEREILYYFPDTKFSDFLDVHHNYANLENHFGKNVWVHRKGATSAKEGELGIIPGNQASASYITRGLGNKLSFCSSSHGAGRKLGRNDACRTLNADEQSALMKDVGFSGWGKKKLKDEDGNKVDFIDLSEAPGAYKDISVVMKNQEDICEIVTELLPIENIKG